MEREGGDGKRVRRVQMRKTIKKSLLPSVGSGVSLYDGYMVMSSDNKRQRYLGLATLLGEFHISSHRLVRQCNHCRGVSTRRLVGIFDM